jgi:hypothetical protein
MVAMRIYVASTLPLLAAAKASGLVSDRPTTAYAVTPRLREWYFEGDLEELEYAAMGAAARASLALLVADPAARRRRVVLAADVPEEWIRPIMDGGRQTTAQVSVSEPVPWSTLASVQVDGQGAERLIADAADAAAAAADGDEDAQFAVDSAEDESLLWYAVQEVDDLLAAAAERAGGTAEES